MPPAPGLSTRTTAELTCLSSADRSASTSRTRMPPGWQLQGRPPSQKLIRDEGQMSQSTSPKRSQQKDDRRSNEGNRPDADLLRSRTGRGLGGQGTIWNPPPHPPRSLRSLSAP